jgi:hypothetical protein
MKKIFSYIAVAMLALGFAGCSDDDAAVTPSAISNLHAESTPARIVLRWTTPDDGTVKYIQVNYFDPRTKKANMRLASIYADSLEIPETRARYGAYDFTVKTVSPTGHTSEEQHISFTSEPAQMTAKAREEVKLTADMLSTNAQEPSEGPIANLLDGDTSTFFHTAWSVSVDGTHTMTVALPEALTDFAIYYAPRANTNNKPTDFDLLGSTDGEEWFLIKNFTKEHDDLPTSSTATYDSGLVKSSQPFTYLKLAVNQTNNGTSFWTMSEFRIYKYEYYDPETEEEEVEG